MNILWNVAVIFIPLVYSVNGSCKEKPNPCVCKGGKPTVGGIPPYCKFYCTEDDKGRFCDELITNDSCKKKPQPCDCQGLKPIWDPECKFGCFLENMVLTCDQIVNGSCKNEPQPCDCPGGEPMWEELNPGCNFGCLYDDMLLPCEHVADY